MILYFTTLALLKAVLWCKTCMKYSSSFHILVTHFLAIPKLKKTQIDS